jgi:hypothetical protein
VFLRSVLQLLVTANVVSSSLILSIQLVFLRSVLQLLATANVVPSSLIFLTLMMEAPSSSEKSVVTKPHGVVSEPRSAARAKAGAASCCTCLPECVLPGRVTGTAESTAWNCLLVVSEEQICRLISAAKRLSTGGWPIGIHAFPEFGNRRGCGIGSIRGHFYPRAWVDELRLIQGLRVIFAFASLLSQCRQMKPLLWPSGQSSWLKILRSLMKGVFWDVTPCGSCKNRRIGGT